MTACNGTFPFSKREDEFAPDSVTTFPPVRKRPPIEIGELPDIPPVAIEPAKPSDAARASFEKRPPEPEAPTEDRQSSELAPPESATAVAQATEEPEEPTLPKPNVALPSASQTEPEKEIALTEPEPVEVLEQIEPPSVEGIAESTNPAPAEPESATDAPSQTGELRLSLADRGPVAPKSLVLAHPGEKLRFKVALDDAKATLRVKAEADRGTVKSASAEAVEWTAPDEPGLARLSVRAEEARAQGATEVPIMVCHPFDRDGSGEIAGYPIGPYPDERGAEATAFVREHRKTYTPPKWFIRVTPEVEALQLSPNFTVGEFSPGAERGKTHFIAIEPRLVKTLEALRAEAKKTYGQKATVRILRAYMAPAERRQLEKKGVEYTLFARYQYGDGCAIVVDTDGAGRMSDLNRDGKRDIEDARSLATLVEKVRASQGGKGWVGSFGEAKEPDWPKTPFVVFDMRGVDAE